ncbi:Tubby C-terminal-like domain [Phytophthora cactorum]|nr:Tubby C-terminal-like domain [Phytophthora cactorum]
MSFFTLDTFQQYHQEVGAAMASKVDSNPESPSSPGKKKANTKHEEKRPSSRLDPLSALNLARASASAVAAASLKVFAVDHLDEDWGEFVTFTPRDEKTFPSTRSGEVKGFAGILLDRLLSLGSSSPRPNAPISPAPKRNYDSYDVTFDHGPVGLDLETDWYGRQAVVKGFRAINAAGDEGLAKRCGMIRVGDVLTAINGESCLEVNFQETLEALRRAGKSRHTLHFKSLEAAGDLSAERLFTNTSSGSTDPNESMKSNPHELVLGCVERLRGEFVTALNFHREETGEFLLAASCASDGSGHSHLRTMREIPQSEDSAVYLGRLEPSFLGTEFTLFDHHTGSTHDNELAFLVYSANVLGRVPNSDGLEAPNKPSSLLQQRSGMGSDGAVFNTHKHDLVAVPVSRIDSTASSNRAMATDGALSWLDDDDVEGHSRSMRVKQARLRGERTASMGEIPYGAVEQEEHEKDLLVFDTKQPSWNEELGAWTLNFQGRVKVASKKNFLLVGNETKENGEEEEITALRFGKVSKTRFSLDYAAPLAPIQALAVACSAFANKRAVT